jgi:3-mercaptopyruvate sulfurtransferase SseA
MKKIAPIIFPIFAVAITIFCLWKAHQLPIAPKSSFADIQRQAEKGGYQLIDTNSLWEMIKAPDSNILLVDVRQAWEYRSGYINGAVNFPMEPTWLSRWQKKEALHDYLGPDKQKTIVFY